MKYKPSNSVLISQMGTKQSFAFTPSDPLLSMKLNTSFEIGSVSAKATKLSQSRYHLTSVRLPSIDSSNAGDTAHVELVIRYHPGIDPGRLKSLIEQLQDIVTQPRFSEELLHPGILG